MRKLIPIFVAVVALGAGFVWQTGRDLPPIVASHFTLAGHADGYMPRAAYLGLMLAMVILMPLSVVAAGWLVGQLPPRFVNLPQREHWLAPERRAATIGSLCNWLAVFGCGLLVLLCSAHWQVVRANTDAAAGTSAGLGLALFTAGSLCWAVALYRRFARVP